MWVQIPLESCIFILIFSLPPRSEQVSGAYVNEIKHDNSPVVIVVLDPRHDKSYKALYIYSRSIALMTLTAYKYTKDMNPASNQYTIWFVTLQSFWLWVSSCKDACQLEEKQLRSVGSNQQIYGKRIRSFCFHI